ncbi:MAG: DUF547 domain-containing protein [Hyphomicrobiales bacterium]|nr:DUF547 domain-containing protein [Hyphomicrobiales bacterium]
MNAFPSDFSTDRRKFVGGLAAAFIAAALPAAPASAKGLASQFAPAGRSAIDVDHGLWDDLLSRHLVAGADGINRIAYRAFKAGGMPALSAYLETLQKIDPRQLARSDQAAFWINLYNAATISVVLERYPVGSIRDINLGGGLFGRGPWRKKLLTVGGVALSLDDIEHEILRPGLADARIHYAVNCASISCPNLQPHAFTGANIERLFEAGARAYVNHSRGLRVKNGRIYASSIFDWYASDFGGSTGARRHWRRYAAPDLAEAVKKASGKVEYGYDWTLNDAG